MGNTRVAAVAICKNEERNIIRWIDNVSTIADEIYILDTGSTDKTLDIIHDPKYRINVGHFLSGDNHSFSFADARNQALDMIDQQFDWIIFTDIDEVFRIDSMKALNAVIRNEDLLRKHPELDAIAVELHNLNGDGSIKTITRNINPRIIRWRGPNTVTFSGDLHEQITIGKQLRKYKLDIMGTTPIIILDHYGYTKESIEKTNKGERNAKIAKRIYESAPNNLRFMEHYAGSLDLAGKHDEAYSLRESRINDVVALYETDKELFISIMRGLIAAAFVVREPSIDKFLGYYTLAESIAPWVPDWNYLLGRWADANNMPMLAQIALRDAIENVEPYTSGRYIGETCTDIDFCVATLKKWSEYGDKG